MRIRFSVEPLRVKLARLAAGLLGGAVLGFGYWYIGHDIGHPRGYRHIVPALLIMFAGGKLLLAAFTGSGDDFADMRTKAVHKRAWAMGIDPRNMLADQDPVKALQADLVNAQGIGKVAASMERDS
jgi:hypothetical protein